MSLPVLAPERAVNIGSSEAAALFGLSPWSTPWQLYMIKAGKLPAEILNKEWVAAGTFIEPAIATWAQHKFEPFELRKVRRYITHPTVKGMGASIDYETVVSPRVPVECKYSMRGDGWTFADGELTECPPHYLIQVHHQMACTGAPHAWLVAFINGTLHKLMIPRNDTLIANIEAAVTEFWQSIADGKEPAPDFLEDAEAIDRILPRISGGKAIEGDAAFEALCKTYVEAHEAELLAANTKKAARAEISIKMGDAAIAKAGVYKVSAAQILENIGKVVTQDMVGTYVGGRKGYRRMVVGTVKQKETDNAKD